MAAGDLVTLADALAWAGLSSDSNGQYAALISAVSTQIQEWLGYQVSSQSYSSTFNGRGTDRMTIADRPMTAVASLTIDGLTIPPSVNQSSGYVFDEKSVYLIGYRFSRGVQNVAITYTAGYAAVPSSIAMACKIWVKATWDRAQRSADLIKFRAGDTEKQYDKGDSAEPNPSALAMPAEVYPLLAPFRRVAPAW